MYVYQYTAIQFTHRPLELWILVREMFLSEIQVWIF